MPRRRSEPADIAGEDADTGFFETPLEEVAEVESSVGSILLVVSPVASVKVLGIALAEC